jgi:GR25 family glycosyltransferase involved in LPS biosynthesis
MIPNDFDPQIYLELNYDIKNYKEPTNHYLKYGIKENRIYKYEQIPDRCYIDYYNDWITKKNSNKIYDVPFNGFKDIMSIDFNPKTYLELNYDIKNHTYYKTNPLHHYIKYGIKENRIYKYEQIPNGYSIDYYNDWIAKKNSNKIYDTPFTEFELSNSSMQKFLINLKRCPDKLDKFNKISPFKNYKLIYGFDIKNIENEYDNNKVKKFTNLKPEEIGYFISHLRIYEIMVKYDINHALIINDDVKFCDDFNDELENSIKNIQNYDILYIGGRFTPNFIMNSSNYTYIVDNIVKHKYQKDYNFNNNLSEIDLKFRLDTDRKLNAYIISLKAVKLLLNIFNNLKTINNQIDYWIIETLLYYDLKIYSCNPLLCYSDLVDDSHTRK